MAGNTDRATDRVTDDGTGRRYPRREEAAARTRRALVSAASDLFVERGYPATTIAAIAERAGVSRATVFTSIPGGKPELLKLARDVAIAGDDEPLPIPQRSWFLEAMAQTDPTELIKRQAANYARILQRAARLEDALVVGAAGAPELAELERTAREQRSLGTRLVVDRLVELGAIEAPGAQTAADALYALAGPAVYLLLTRDRGWSDADYERWLAQTMAIVLLRH